MTVAAIAEAMPARQRMLPRVREAAAITTQISGDTVLIPPDMWHWHGVAPDGMFIRLAVKEDGGDGAGTQWLEYVTDVNYSAPGVEAE